MNAITEAPKSVGCVAFSCASAITSPSADSPVGAFPPAETRVMSAVIAPTTSFAIGADAVL